jgi:hypothetical protein
VVVQAIVAFTQQHQVHVVVQHHAVDMVHVVAQPFNASVTMDSKGMIVHNYHALQELHGGMRQAPLTQRMLWLYAPIEGFVIPVLVNVFAKLDSKVPFAKEYPAHWTVNLENVRELEIVIPHMNVVKSVLLMAY